MNKNIPMKRAQRRKLIKRARTVILTPGDLFYVPPEAKDTNYRNHRINPVHKGDHGGHWAVHWSVVDHRQGKHAFSGGYLGGPYASEAEAVAAAKHEVDLNNNPPAMRAHIQERIAAREQDEQNLRDRLLRRYTGGISSPVTAPVSYPARRLGANPDLRSHFVLPSLAPLSFKKFRARFSSLGSGWRVQLATNQGSRK